jgi:hypothetical protein
MLGLEKIVSKFRGIAGPAVVEVARVEWIGPHVTALLGEAPESVGRS